MGLYYLNTSKEISHAITENNAVFFYSPMTYQTKFGCLIPNRFHVLECMDYLKAEPTDIFVVNLKTGKVQEMQVDDAHFFQHHINAFEVNEGKEIIVDLSPSDPWGLR